MRCQRGGIAVASPALTNQSSTFPGFDAAGSNPLSSATASDCRSSVDRSITPAKKAERLFATTHLRPELYQLDSGIAQLARRVMVGSRGGFLRDAMIGRQSQSLFENV
ncbi:MAG: hypothetical protein AAF745_12420 [Planctomycetota bacterium]